MFFIRSKIKKEAFTLLYIKLSQVQKLMELKK